MRYQLPLSRNEAAIEAPFQTMGWRLYVLNVPADQFSLAQAVLAYRGSPNIEWLFSRLKGRPLGLRPVYLHREDHLTAETPEEIALSIMAEILLLERGATARPLVEIKRHPLALTTGRNWR